MGKERKFTLKTTEGQKRLLAITSLLILFSAFFARLIITDFGEIKINEFKIEARGALINGEIMYPAGTSSEDKLPCVIFTHGTGCSYGIMKHFASELARRGFVTLAVSTYGAGLSEQPLFDEMGHGTDIGKTFAYGNTTAGMLDCVNFVRSLEFVDKTRIGVSGHSMGARITQYTALADCGFLTYNDIMINVLCDTFGQSFTREEINRDAAALAAERLTQRDLAYYNYLAKENRMVFDSKIRGIFPMGNAMEIIAKSETVKVAGYDVQRGCQVNIGAYNGVFDNSSVNFKKSEVNRKGWYTGNDNIQLRKWYGVDTVNASSKILGDFGNLSITTNTDLAKAMQNRSARVYIENPESHSRNFFSLAATADCIAFFQQALNYSNGNLTSGAVPMAPTNQIWIIGRFFNLIALLSMIGLMITLLVMLSNLKFYTPCIGTESILADSSVNKKIYYWIFAVAAVVFTFIAGYFGNKMAIIRLVSNPFLPLSHTSGAVFNFILIIGGLSLVSLIAKCLVTKKETGKFSLATLNLKLGGGGILKSFLLGIILIAAGYVSLMIIEYLFNEDYRFFMAIITYMKVDYWFIVPRYAIIFLVPYLAIGAAINYNAIRTDIPEWKDTLITVIVNSIGIWLLCVINLIVSHATGAEFSGFIVSYQLLLFVPITVYISRKMYNVTKSIWVGAIFNSILVAWSMTSSLGIHTIYVGQNWLSIFFNI